MVVVCVRAAVGCGSTLFDVSYIIAQFSKETFHALIVPCPQPTTRLAQDDSHGSSSAVLQRSFSIFPKGRRLQSTQCHYKWSVPHPVTRLLVHRSDLRAALLIDNPTREALVSALLSDIGSCKPGSTGGRLHHTGTHPISYLRPLSLPLNTLSQMHTSPFQLSRLWVVIRPGHPS